MWEHFQGESKVDDNNEDKTAKLVCDPTAASRKWIATNWKAHWQAGLTVIMRYRNTFGL